MIHTITHHGEFEGLEVLFRTERLSSRYWSSAMLALRHSFVPRCSENTRWYMYANVRKKLSGRSAKRHHSCHFQMRLSEHRFKRQTAVHSGFEFARRRALTTYSLSPAAKNKDRYRSVVYLAVRIHACVCQHHQPWKNILVAAMGYHPLFSLASPSISSLPALRCLWYTEWCIAVVHVAVDARQTETLPLPQNVSNKRARNQSRRLPSALSGLCYRSFGRCRL